MSENFCVTLTTIPARLKEINKTINSINNQTLKPKKIFLNIPKQYYRFPNEKIDESYIKKIENENIVVSRCDDYGPATKLMGSIQQIREFDCAIIIDDDHIYHEKMCEIFIEEFNRKRINYSFYSDKIFDIKMAQCADGFLVNTDFLDKIEIFYKKNVMNNKNLFMDDDFWFALYFQLNKKVETENIIEIFRKKTGKKIVYDIHSNKEALSKSVHNPNKIINRKKIAKIEYIKFKVKRFLSLNN